MSNVKKILLISASFYPQNKISTLRVGQLAKYWSLLGHDVTVLTCTKYSFLGPFGLEEELPSNINVIEVDFLPTFLVNKYRNINSKFKKSVFNPSSNSSLNILKKIVRSLRNKVGSLFDIHGFWISPAIKIGLKCFEDKDFDLIVSSYSPPAVHVIASELKRKNPQSIWLADFRDPWSNNHINSARGIFKWYEDMKEKKTLTQSDYICTVSDPITNEYSRRYSDKTVFTVENGFDPDEFPNWNVALKQKNGTTKKKLQITYAGTIYPNKRDPTPLFEACNDLIDDGVITSDEVSINFYGNSDSILNEIISNGDFNRYNIIKLHGFVSRSKSLSVQKNSDLLLMLEWNNPKAIGVLTGKLFEYLASGVPIIAIGVSEHSSIGKIIFKTGTGTCHLTKSDVKNRIIEIINNKYEIEYNKKVEELSKYSRENQARSIINKIFDEKIC